MFRLFALLAVLALASPASAVIDLVSIDHPESVTVDLPGYGWRDVSVSGDLNSAVAAASAGDTIYVDTGTYAHGTHAIAAGNWPANDVVVIGPATSVAEITVTSSGAYAVTTPAVRTGCKVVNMTFRGTAAGARALNVSSATAGPFTLDNVTFNNTGLSIYHSGAGAAVGIVITNCAFTAMQDDPALAYIYTQSGSDGWSFTNNTFDMASATIDGGGTSALSFGAMQDLVFTGNVVSLPLFNQAAGYGIWLTGNGAVNADAPLISHNTIVAQENESGTFRVIAVGATATATIGSVDDVVISYNTVTMPAAPSTAHYGIELEYAPATGQTWSEGFQIIGNRISGGTNGILLAEGAARGTVARNWVTGTSGAGIFAQDTRRTVYTFNLIEDCVRGFYSDDNGSLASNNYGNFVVGNLFRRCTSGILLDGASYAANDSAAVYAGNVFDACDAVATQNTTDLDLATWQAYTPLGGVSPAGLGSVDLSETDVTGELRAVRGLPGGGARIFGSARAGLRR